MDQKLDKLYRTPENKELMGRVEEALSFRQEKGNVIPSEKELQNSLNGPFNYDEEVESLSKQLKKLVEFIRSLV
jgi:hypothetical protein